MRPPIYSKLSYPTRPTQPASESTPYVYTESVRVRHHKATHIPKIPCNKQLVLQSMTPSLIDPSRIICEIVDAGNIVSKVLFHVCVWSRWDEMHT